MTDQDRRNMVKNAGLNLLKEGKNIRIRAHGYSMFPNIRPGSLLIIEPISVKGMPVPGEIIAISTGHGLIIHRLGKFIRKNGQKMFVARGDSNMIADIPLPEGRIAGRVTGSETTDENKIPADIGIKNRPRYFTNRGRVIGISLWKKARKLI
jgi:signal peptidase I